MVIFRKIKYLFFLVKSVKYDKENGIINILSLT